MPINILIIATGILYVITWAIFWGCIMYGIFHLFGKKPKLVWVGFVLLLWSVLAIVYRLTVLK